MTLERDDITSFGASVGIHALLFLIALFWAIASEPAPLRDLELVFLSPGASPELPEVRTEPPRPAPQPQLREHAPQRAAARRATTPQARARRAIQRPASPHTERNAQSPSTGGAAATTPRNAPGAPPTAPPGTLRPAPRSAAPVDFTGQTSPISGLPAQSRPGAEAAAAERRDTKEPASQGGLPQRDTPAAGSLPSKPGPPTAGALSDSPGASMQIAWDGAARTRVSGRLPVFPRDAQREAQVRVKFTVRPDGSVTDLLLVQKAAPAFEESALVAVRTWRFTPLSKASRHADQTATAVFTFKLK